MHKKIMLFATIGCISLTTTFIACTKEETTASKISNRNTGYALSPTILKYDSYVKSYKGNIPLGRFQTLIAYAKADGAGAMAVLNIATKIPALLAAGPGYPAAMAFIGGVCGSLYHYIETHYNYRSTTEVEDLDPVTTTNTNVLMNFTSSQVGQFHNDYMDTAINSIETGSLTPSSKASIYNFLISKTNSKFNVNPSTFFSEEDLNRIKNYRLGEKNAEEIYNIYIANEVPVQVASYMRDFFSRIENPQLYSVEQVTTYADLFLEDLNSQSVFTEGEKLMIANSISICKGSIQYWEKKI